MPGKGTHTNNSTVADPQPSSGPYVSGPSAGGDGDAIHGGDPDELVIDEMLTKLDTLFGKIERGELNGRIGLAPDACPTQPLGIFCETLNLSAAQKSYVEDFTKGAAASVRDLLRTRSQARFRFTARFGSVRASDGQIREVLAWIENDAAGKPIVMLNESVRTLETARKFALVSHEVLHLANRIEDGSSAPLFPSAMGEGRRLADTVGAALATLVYLRDTAKAPTLVGLYLIGGRVAELKRNGSTYQLVNEYGSASGANITEVNGTFRIVSTNPEWNGVTGEMDYRGTIRWSNNTVWAPHPFSVEILGLVGSYAFEGGCRVERTGDSIRFINERGAVSAGSMLSGTRVIAEDWNGLSGTINTAGDISWNNGTFWRRTSPR